MGRKRCSPDTRSTVWWSAWIPTSGCSGPPWWPGGRSEDRVTARAEAVSSLLTGRPSRSLPRVTSRIRLGSVSSMNCTSGSMSAENRTGLCMGLSPLVPGAGWLNRTAQSGILEEGPDHGSVPRGQHCSSTEPALRLHRGPPAGDPACPARPESAAAGAAGDPNPRRHRGRPRRVVGGELAVPGRAQADGALLSRQRGAGQGAAGDVAAVRAAVPPALHHDRHATAPGRAGPGRGLRQSGRADVLAGGAAGGAARDLPARPPPRRELAQNPIEPPPGPAPPPPPTPA